MAGCNYDNLTVTSSDGGTGQTSTKTYSKFYDAGEWLIKDRLGLVVVVDHEHKAVPGLHGLAQSMGMLGKGDSIAAGKVALYLWNFDSVAHDVRFKRMVVAAGELDFQNQTLTAAPNDRTETEAGLIPIFNYGTNIQVTVKLDVAGKPKSIRLNLQRRTVDQLKHMYAPGATRPYPWGSRSLKN